MHQKFKLFAAAAVAAVAEARIEKPFAVAKEFNEQRDVCEVAMERKDRRLNDGLKKLRKRMTTEVKYKNFLLADCNKRKSKEGKLRCI